MQLRPSRITSCAVLALFAVSPLALAAGATSNAEKSTAFVQDGWLYTKTKTAARPAIEVPGDLGLLTAPGTGDPGAGGAGNPAAGAELPEAVRRAVFGPRSHARALGREHEGMAWRPDRYR